jgi:ADP-ribose pyrophosphatase
VIKKYSQISSKILLKNPYWDYKFDEYVLPSGNTGNYHYVETRGAVMIIPLSIDGKLVLVKQFRYLNRKNSIEFPGGGINPDFSEIENAKKELIEEAGIIAESVIRIGEFNPCNGVINEICGVVLASDITFTTAVPEESEEFEILFLTNSEIMRLINDGSIWDGMTLAAWSIYRFSKYFTE